MEKHIQNIDKSAKELVDSYVKGFTTLKSVARTIECMEPETAAYFALSFASFLPDSDEQLLRRELAVLILPLT